MCCCYCVFQQWVWHDEAEPRGILDSDESLFNIVDSTGIYIYIYKQSFYLQFRYLDFIFSKDEYLQGNVLILIVSQALCF